MNATEILRSSYEDIIFENRHKAYGAYDIRKKYNRNLRIALGIAIGLILLVVLYPFIKGLFEKEEVYAPIEEVTTTVEMAAPPPMDEELPPPPEVKLPQIEQIKFVPPKVVEKVTKEEEIATVEEIKQTANIGDKTQEGEKTVISEPVQEIIKEVEKPEAPLLIVEKMPKFPGGDAALYGFIQKNIRYPQQAQDFNIQGKVIVQFVVNKDGKITEPKVLKDIGGGCGQEALRVVSLLPSWEPGEQAGRKVPVIVRVPIKFELK